MRGPGGGVFLGGQEITSESKQCYSFDCAVTASLPPSFMRMDSNTEPSYRSMLNRVESIDARRAAGLEESITSLNRQRYTSLRRDDMLGSLVETQGYIDAGSLYSVPSQSSLTVNEEVDGVGLSHTLVDHT